MRPHRLIREICQELDCQHRGADNEHLYQRRCTHLDLPRTRLCVASEQGQTVIFPGQALGTDSFFSVVAYRPQTLGEVPTPQILSHASRHRQRLLSVSQIKTGLLAFNANATTLPSSTLPAASPVQNIACWCGPYRCACGHRYYGPRYYGYYGPRRYYGPRVYVGPRYRYYGWRRW